MAAKKDKGFPMTIGACADLIYTKRAARIAKAKEVEAMKDEEDRLEEHIKDLLKAQNLTSGRGEIATVTIVPKSVPSIADWEKFAAWLIKKRENLVCIQRRLATRAVQELIADKKVIPGVEVIDIKDLSINKAG